LVGETWKMITSRDFVVCVRNGDYHASLELRKIYQVLPDEKAKKKRSFGS